MADAGLRWCGATPLSTGWRISISVNPIDVCRCVNSGAKVDIPGLRRRLAPDMQPFIYQVQSACDYVKGAAAWLSGQRPPKHEDKERTIDEVRARIRKTAAFVKSVKGINMWALNGSVALPDRDLTDPELLVTSNFVICSNGQRSTKFMGPRKSLVAHIDAVVAQGKPSKRGSRRSGS
jgi:hypothetical protein